MKKKQSNKPLKKTSKKTAKKPFYHSLVKTKKIYLQLEKTNLQGEQYSEVLCLIEETINTHAVSTLLNKLPQEKHETFMEKLSQEPHSEELWDFFGEEKDNAKDHLSQVFGQLEEEILQDFFEKEEDV